MFLQNEPEAGVVVAQIVPLFLGQLEHMVMLTGRPLLILPPHGDNHGRHGQSTNPHEGEQGVVPSQVGCTGIGLLAGQQKGGALTDNEDVGADGSDDVVYHDLDQGTEYPLPSTQEVILKQSQAHCGGYIGAPKTRKTAPNLESRDFPFWSCRIVYLKVVMTAPARMKPNDACICPMDFFNPC
jgi:hypothetical protein